MSLGKYLSLREARKKKKTERFVAEHPSQGDRSRFGRLLDSMIRTPESADQTSSKKPSGED